MVRGALACALSDGETQGLPAHYTPRHPTREHTLKPCIALADPGSMGRSEPAANSLVLPVRLVDPDRVLQTTASDLRSDGAFVHTTTPPRQGSLLALGLYLPDSWEPLVLSAVAGRQGEARRGFDVEFATAKGAPRRLEHVLDLAKRAAAPNLRTFSRVPTDFRILVPSPDGVSVRRVADAGPTGMFIETSDAASVGSVLPVVVDLPDGKAPTVVTVEVVRRQEARADRAAGMGVQFIGADDEFRERLDALLRSEAQTAIPRRVDTGA